MSARVCANPECRSVIDAERVRRRPTIGACCPACKQEVYRRRRDERPNDAGDVTGRRTSGGPRGIALPYRRTLAAVAEALNTITPGRRVDECEDPFVVAAEILEPCLSLTNRKRLSRLEQEYPAEAGR